MVHVVVHAVKPYLLKEKSRIFGCRGVVSQIYAVWIELTEGVVIWSSPFPSCLHHRQVASPHHQLVSIHQVSDPLWLPHLLGWCRCNGQLVPPRPSRATGTLARPSLPSWCSRGFATSPCEWPKGYSALCFSWLMFLCAPPDYSGAIKRAVRWRWPIGSHLKGRLMT